MKNGLGLLVKQYREQRKLTQAKLAASVNCDQTAISKIETGARTVTDIDLLTRLAEFFGVPPAHFWEEAKFGKPAYSSEEPVSPSRDETVPAHSGKMNATREASSRPLFEQEAEATPLRLMTAIWTYQLTGKNQASWAVKESATLMGDLGTGREKPGLGVAIVTTEIAISAFGEAADGRVDQCIAWAIGHTESCAPYRMQQTVLDYINYAEIEIRPDFRHTLAFAVILARSHKQYHYLEAYLLLALERQNADGGWPSDSVTTVSPVFTSLYAIELLHLASTDPDLPPKLCKRIPTAITKGIVWLMNQRKPNGLWSSTVFQKFIWDGPFTAAWVLHRLIPTTGLDVAGWTQCLDDAMFAMIRNTLDSATWSGSSESQRNRVEARVAAAAARALGLSNLSRRSFETSRAYLGSWKERAKEWVSRQPAEEIDVGTAAFMLWAMVPVNGLAELGHKVLSSSK